LIHIDVDPSWDDDDDVSVEDGDQRIRDESVDVDKRVGVEGNFEVVLLGRQERDVMPASWPMRSASKVIENCCDLW
jgi:hypothetical protein